MMKGEPIQIGKGASSLRDAFGQALVDLGLAYNFLVVDSDVAGGTGAWKFREKHPDRFKQFGIAEQNMMAAAAGINIATGFPVIVTTFASFALRAWEQARLSIAYPRRNVKIVCSHGGLDTGPDGASAQCIEDFAIWCATPNMVVLAPCDAEEVKQATEWMLNYDGPVYMRTGRSSALPVFTNNDCCFSLYHAQTVRYGNDITLMACGKMTAYAKQAALLLAEDGIDARVVNVSSLKPIDVATITQCAYETKGIITCEDHNIINGLGSRVASTIVGLGLSCPVRFIGVKDVFGESGEPDELMQKYGIDVPAIVREAKELVTYG